MTVSLLWRVSRWIYKRESLWRKTGIKNGSSCLVSFDSFLFTHCPHMVLITKNVAITKFLSQKFTFMWSSAISRKFWTMKIWSYAVFNTFSNFFGYAAKDLWNESRRIYTAYLCSRPPKGASKGWRLNQFYQNDISFHKLILLVYNNIISQHGCYS